MKIYLAVTGKRPFREGFEFPEIFRILSSNGHELAEVKYFPDMQAFEAAAFSYEDDSTVICVGREPAVKKYLEANAMKENGLYFISSVCFFVSINSFEKNLKHLLIPYLAEHCEDVQTVSCIKIFSMTRDEIYDIADEELSGAPEGITFTVTEPSPLDCTLYISYSQHNRNVTAFNEYIFKLVERLDDRIYARKDLPIEEVAADLLLKSKRKLSVAESFTGGGIAAALTKYPGMSSCLLESLVTYSYESKMMRLGVSAEALAGKGAVSAETAYQMAMGLFKNPDADIVIATTGNAGPTAQNGNVGECYIAAGDIHDINIYNGDFLSYLEGTEESLIRQEITRMGVKYALFGLIKYLRK